MRPRRTSHVVARGSTTRAPLPERRLWILAASWLALYTLGLWLLRSSHVGDLVMRDGVYILPIAAAAVLAARAARAHVGTLRLFWTLLAASNALWLVGELVWGVYEVVLDRESPFPSAADACYIASYALVVPAVVLGFKSTSVWRAARGLLDASVVVVAVGVSGWLLLIEPQLTGAWSLATATGIAYPLLGVLILMVLFLVAFGGNETVPRSVRIVAIAFAIAAVTDALYTYVAVLHEFVDGTWLNVGWQAEALLLALAAYGAVSGADGAPRERAEPRSGDRGLPLVLLGIFATALVVLVDGRSGGGGLSGPTLALLIYAVAALVVRLHLTARDKDAIASALQQSLGEQERLAFTDPLTELHNRRFFEAVLRLEGERAERNGTPLAVVVIDLDHFKRVNDAHGHPAGDAVLRAAASRLTAVIRGGDVLARYGGEEFVVVLPDADAAVADEVGERCRRAICASPVRLGDGLDIRVTASVGAAVLPTHAADVDDLVRTADGALYLAKRLGRNQTRVGRVTSDEGVSAVVADNRVVEYLQVLADDIDSRQAAEEHSLAMARWAGRIAEHLGLPQEQAWRAVLAARLHDIGKVVVPDAVLTKPGPLGDDEWRIVREHPEQGARLVALDPLLTSVAEAIRDHHERPDGRGYPHGKGDGEVGIEARIIAVCDAWAAMLATRHYRDARSPDRARAELAAGRGTQFAEEVVDAFLELQAVGIVGDLEVAGEPAQRA